MYPGLIVDRHINYIPPELEWGNTNGPILNGRSGDQSRDLVLILT